MGSRPKVTENKLKKNKNLTLFATSFEIELLVQTLLGYVDSLLKDLYITTNIRIGYKRF